MKTFREFLDIKLDEVNRPEFEANLRKQQADVLRQLKALDRTQKELLKKKDALEAMAARAETGPPGLDPYVHPNDPWQPRPWWQQSRERRQDSMQAQASRDYARKVTNREYAIHLGPKLAPYFFKITNAEPGTKIDMSQLTQKEKDAIIDAIEEYNPDLNLVSDYDGSTYNVGDTYDI